MENFKEYLQNKKSYGRNEINKFCEFDKVEKFITDCPLTACSINEKGHCISTNTVQCTSIPNCFDEDRE